MHTSLHLLMPAGSCWSLVDLCVSSFSMLLFPAPWGAGEGKLTPDFGCILYGLGTV